MRYVKSPLGIFVFAFAAAVVAACGGGAGNTAATDSSASMAAAAAAAPPAESYALVGDDGSWTVDISPAGVVWVKSKGKKDSLLFEFKPPSVDGAISEYKIARIVPDTHTFGAMVVLTPCTDKQKKEYTHKAQVWIDQVAYTGCATKK